jgi:N-acetylneuraminic acid mutarotase
LHRTAIRILIGGKYVVGQETLTKTLLQRKQAGIIGLNLNKCMGLLFVLVFLTVSCVIIVKPAWTEEGFWTSMSPIITARIGLGVAVVEGKIYAIGGGNDWISPYLGTNEMYDPATDTWTTKASMPTPRRDFAIAVYKNKIYCIGGESGYDPEGLGGIYTEVNEVYDPATDTWETKAPIPTARYGMCVNVVDGKIYVIGGGHHHVYPANICTGKNEVYDPETDTWTERTPLPTPVLGAASAAMDGKIYVLGGQAGLFLGGWHDFNQVYDVKNDTWSTAAPVPVGFDRAAAGATTGVFAAKRIYVFGGFTEASYTPQNLTQVYDPENNVWGSGAEMLSPHANFGVAVVNDKLYAISGSQVNIGPPSVANEKYTPADHENPTSPTPSPLPSQEPTSTIEPFTIALVAVVSGVAVAVGAGLLFYFKKHKRYL